MRLAWGFLLLGLSTSAWAQTERTPERVWQRNAEEDTTLVLPYGLAVESRSGNILVADMQLPGIVELDGATGRTLRVLGRNGDGPGEFKMPQRVALSPDGSLLAVYDVGRRTLDVLTRNGKAIRRIPIGTIWYLKGFAISNDTTVVLAGGRVDATGTPVAVTWVNQSIFGATGPVPPQVPGLEKDRDWDGRLYAAGGPLTQRGDSTFMADAGSGDIWLATPNSVQKLAPGRGAPPNLIASIIQPVEVDGQAVKRISFNFPQAVFVETRGGNRFLSAYSDKTTGSTTFYQNGSGTAPLDLGSWAINPTVMVRYDAESFIVRTSSEDGWQLSRVRMPVE